MCLSLPPTTEKTWQLVETASLSLDTGGDNDGQSNRIHNNANPHQALISWGMQRCFPAPAAWLLYSRHAGKHVAAAQQTCDLQRNHKAPASLGDRCCAHWPHLLPPESKMHPKGNQRAREGAPAATGYLSLALECQGTVIFPTHHFIYMLQQHAGLHSNNPDCENNSIPTAAQLELPLCTNTFCFCAYWIPLSVPLPPRETFTSLISFLLVNAYKHTETHHRLSLLEFPAQSCPFSQASLKRCIQLWPDHQNLSYAAWPDLAQNTTLPVKRQVPRCGSRDISTGI